MSAAAPLPYPRAPPSDGFDNSGERAFKHIDDVKLDSKGGYDPQSSLPHLLSGAETALKQSQNLLDFRRPDLAFAEFLRASDIIVDVIPHHKDYTHFTIDQPEPAKRLQVLQKKVFSETKRFDNIKHIIVDNNKRFGTRPQVATQNGRQTPNGVSRKPAPSPKPEKLHGRALSTAVNGGVNGAVSSDLDQRFARLRMLDTQARPNSRGSDVSSVHSSPIRSQTPLTMPSAGEYANGRSSFDALGRVPSLTARPQGPRANGVEPGMPAPITISNFPQAPPTVYSPARNMETTGNIAPPRHSARSLASSSTRRSSGVPSPAASSHAPNGSAPGGDYFPAQPVSSGRAPPPARRRSSAMPTETQISPDRLYDYLRRYEVLLIDFRSRDEFDGGHIYARNILCVDPLSMRQGMSAEELADALVISPDIEQTLFAQRDEYDFVVYYDNSTANEESLRKPIGQRQVGLKYLREALYDFNLEKPLQRPPILLKGGLEAWTDMIGEQALVTSETLARVKAARPIQRRPMATATANGHAQLRVPKRRMRAFDPLDPEEEKFWRDRARAESVVLRRPPEISADSIQDGIDEEAEDDGSASAAIAEFNQRFPEAGDLDRQAFAAQRPTRAPPEVPAKVLTYPPQVQASAYPLAPGPQAPRRPAPAAPRMSYQGVSDPQVSGGQTASTKQLTPYIPPKFLANNIRLPRTGLVNFRNTCYMNSTIQALSATTPLSVFFMDDGYRSQLQRSSWKGSHGLMADNYANLIRNLWKGDVQVVKPSTFRALVGRLDPTFANDDQQDAKEFFDRVMDVLHEDMNAHWDKAPLRTLTEKEEEKREGMPKLIVSKIEWGRYQHRDLSFVHSLFAGQHASRLTCLKCGFTSTTYEFFTSLSVEIPQNSRYWSSQRGPTLDDCLRSYCQEETLTRDDQWRCPRCKKEREAKKRIILTRAPQFLVIHLKRFATRGQRQAQKIRVPVDFPLNHFSLDPYMLPPPSSSESAHITDLYGPDYVKQEASTTPPYDYDCYAVVRHLGATMQSGHYITAAKDQGRRMWHMYDDQQVHDFQPEQFDLRNEQAYILFYQRNQGGGGSGSGTHGRI